MQRIATTRPRQHRGNARRMRILRFLRENPGSRHADIARAVDLATHHSYSPALETHLTVLERDGYVCREGLAWRAAV